MIFFRYFAHCPAGDFPGFAEKAAAAVTHHNITSVVEGMEAMVPAVGEDDIFEKTLPVYHYVPYLPEMGNEVDVGKAKAVQPSAVLRTGNLALELGVGINSSGAVHRARAAAHNYSVEALEGGFQVDFVNELILCGDVSAAEDNPVGPAHKVAHPGGIMPVKHYDFFSFDSRAMNTLRHTIEDGLRESSVIGRGAHKQHARHHACPAPGAGLSEGFAHSREEAVVRRETILSVTCRTACQKQCHSNDGTKAVSKDTAFTLLDKKADKGIRVYRHPPCIIDFKIESGKTEPLEPSCRNYYELT